MAGLRGLKKSDRPAEEITTDYFISGAKRRVDDLKLKKEKRFERYTFSLTPAFSEQIDQLTLAPDDFRCNRSDVVKAGLLLLGDLMKSDKFELIEVLRRAQES